MKTKKMSCKIISIVLALTFAISMIPIFSIGVSAYQSAFKNGADVTEFSQDAKDKVTGFEVGDNIFALGDYDTETYTTTASYCESGLCQFVPQHNDNKWGRALRDPSWSISGMANVGDGIIDAALSTAPAGGLWFSRTTSGTNKVDANAISGGMYLTLCGWEFAADFTVKGFKIYFNSNAIADDFDLLVGHLDGDNIVWEVAYCGNDVTAKAVAAEGCTNDIVYIEADFCKTYTGRFIQIATKTTDGMNTTKKSGHSGYICSELEVYAGEVEEEKHTVITAPATATCTEAGVVAHYECAICGKYFSDADGKNEITVADIKTAPALGHNFVEGACTRCHAIGGVVTDEASFLAMNAAGMYTLANDITISESFASTFTGSFYGNGYTVTTTVPMFAELGTNANVHDFIVEGEIAGDGYASAVAKQIKSGATNVEIYNVVNNADITGGAQAGGIVGYIAAGATKVTITNCENNGVISGTTAQVGGIVGYAQGQELNIIGCTNNADIVLTASYGGGIIGRFGKDAATKAYICRITDCVNNGDFTAPGAQCGGMIGYVVGSLEITDCVNTGDITNTAADAGGMLGKLAVKGKDNASSIGGFVITGCVNYGAVTGGTFAGGIVAEGSDAAAAAGTYTKSYKINNCANFGNITSTAASNANSYAGGIAAYMFGGSTSNGIQNCINTGDVTVEDAGLAYTKNILAGGIIGYFSATKYYVVGNINAGKVTNEVESTTAAAFGATQIYWNNNAANCSDDYIHDNFALDAGVGAVYGRNGETGADTTTTVFTADELAIGKVTFDINAAIGSAVYGQNLDNGRPVGTAPIPNGAAVYEYTDCQGETRYSNDANHNSHIDNDKDGVCDLCGTGDATRFTGAQLIVGEAFTLKFFAAVSSANEGGKVVFSSEGKEDVELAIGDASKEDNEYVFIYDNIAPNEMGNTITATILDASDKVVTVKEYSVDECREALAETYPGSEKMIELLDKLEDYGKAAEEYLAAVANDAIPTLKINVRIKAEDVTALNLVDGGDYSGDAKFVSAGVYFNNKNRLYFKFTTDVTMIKINGKEYTAFVDDGDYYKVYSDEISATELDDVYTVEIYDGSDLAQTLTYSVYTYCYSMQDSADIATANLVKATYLYGVAAAAYAD